METKFNIGDKVYLELKVDSIEITDAGVTYTLKKNQYEGITAKEEQIVESKYVLERRPPTAYELLRG